MGWIILAAAVLLLVLLLASSASLYVACDNGEFTLTARYLFLKFPLSLEKKGEAPPKVQPKGKGKPKEKPAKEKTPLSESIRLVWDLIQASAQDLGILLSKLRLYDFTLRLSLAAEDAAQTGIRYGQACAYAYSGLALAQGLVKMRRVGKIQLTPDFQAEAPRTDYFFSFCLKLRVGSILRAALRALFRFLLRTAKREKASPAQAKDQ